MKIPFIYKFALFISLVSNAIAWWLKLSTLSPLVALKCAFLLLIFPVALVLAVFIVVSVIRYWL